MGLWGCELGPTGPSDGLPGKGVGPLHRHMRIAGAMSGGRISGTTAHVQGG